MYSSLASWYLLDASDWLLQPTWLLDYIQITYTFNLVHQHYIVLWIKFIFVLFTADLCIYIRGYWLIQLDLDYFDLLKLPQRADSFLSNPFLSKLYKYSF